jgi:Fe-S cluster assembly protein SufD
MEKQLKIDFEESFKNSSFSTKNINIKKEFLNKFIKEGLPNKSLENWKFSDISQIIKKEIGDLSFYNDISAPSKIDPSIYLNGLEQNSIVFVNGRPEKIDFQFEEKNKLEILDDFELNKDYSDINSLINLNNAFVENYSFKKPLVIYHYTNKKVKSKNINLRLNFILEKNSSLKLIDVLNDASEKNFINTFYNFKINQDAILKNYKIDIKNNSNIKYIFTNIEQEKNSLSETFIASSGSDFIKNEINCNLNGEHSSAFVNGIFSLNKQKHHEIRTSINHLTEYTKSSQLIKSVLENDAKAVYQGKIYVSSKAQKTDGYQLSKAILLDETTEFNAKPELEIYADDVKCSHGSASGSLSENSIFYLMSRGLNYKEAKELLISGFLLDVIEKITDSEIKSLIKKMIGLKE